MSPRWGFLESVWARNDLSLPALERNLKTIETFPYLSAIRDGSLYDSAWPSGDSRGAAEPQRNLRKTPRPGLRASAPLREIFRNNDLPCFQRNRRLN